MKSTWATRAVKGTGEARAFSDLDSIFRLEGETVTKGSRSNVVRVRLTDRVYFVKRCSAGCRAWWKGFGRSRPDTEARNLTRASRLGIPTPPVVAAGSERKLGRFVRGAIVTREVEDTDTLKELALGGRIPPTRELQRRIAGRLAHYARRMHSRGFVPRDLEWRNILVRNGGEPEVFLLDCPSGGQLSWPFRTHFIIRELARLDRLARRFVTRTVRLRFTLEYLGRPRLDRSAKLLIRRILKRESRDADEVSR